MANSKRVLTDEDLIQIAKKCNTVSELKAEDESAYQVIRSRGLQDVALAHMRRRGQKKGRTLTKELCKEVAAKYTTLEELRKFDNPVYTKIMKQRWMDCCEHLSKAWTPTTKVEPAAVPKTKPRYEFTAADIEVIRAMAKRHCKEGWIVNASSNVIKGIFKGLVRCEGDCPCANQSKELQCPCSGYREHDHCCCGLYIKLED